MESGEFFGAADNGDFGERFKLVDKDAGVRRLEAATAALAAGKIPEAEEYLRAYCGVEACHMATGDLVAVR